MDSNSVICMKTFNVVFLKIIETPLMHFYHSTDEIASHHNNFVTVGLFDINENAARYKRKSEIQDGGRQTGSKYVKSDSIFA